MRKQIRSTRAQVIDGLAETDLTLGTAVSRDFVNYRVLGRLGLYERRIEHSLYRTMAELAKLRLLQELDQPPAESMPEPAFRTEETPLRQTNPISGHTNTAPPAPICTPGADMGRSCLTTRLGLGIIPQSQGPGDCRIGSRLCVSSDCIAENDAYGPAGARSEP